MAGGSFVCWTMSEGKAGTEAQCLGLAEALGLQPVVKRVSGRKPLRWFTPWFRPRALANLTDDSSPLEPPWPDLIIASGRQPIAPALAVRRLAERARPGQRTYLLQLQDPAFSPRRFDLIVVPKHDRLRGDNVIVTLGAMHRVTRARVAAAAERFAGIAKGLPRPLIAVLLGGPSRVHGFSAERGRELGEQLAAMLRADSGALLITASRRTPPEALAALLQPLAGSPHWLWDGKGDNPYLGILGLADLCVVTSDSITMTCEAVAAGKPVLVAAVDGGSPKFNAFHAEMQARGLTRPFVGRAERWVQPPFDEPSAVAAEVKRRLPLFREAGSSRVKPRET